MALRINHILDFSPNDSMLCFQIKNCHHITSCQSNFLVFQNSGFHLGQIPAYDPNRIIHSSFLNLLNFKVRPLKALIHAHPLDRLLSPDANPSLCVGCFILSRYKISKKHSKKFHVKNTFVSRSHNIAKFALPATLSSLTSSSYNASSNFPLKFECMSDYSLIQDEFYNSCNQIFNSTHIEHNELFDVEKFRDKFKFNEGMDVDVHHVTEMLISVFLANIPAKIVLLETELECILSADDCCTIIQNLIHMNYKECAQEFMEILYDWSFSEPQFLKPVAVGMGIMSAVPQMHNFLIRLKSSDCNNLSHHYYFCALVCSAFIAERHNEAIHIMQLYMNDPVFSKSGNIFLFNLALASCLKQKNSVHFCKILFENGQKCNSIDSVSYALAIFACSLNDDKNRAENLYEQFQEECFIPNINVLNSLLDIFAKNDLKRAENLFQFIESASKPNRLTFITLLSAYAFHADYEKMKMTVNAMVSSGIELEINDWISVLITEGLQLDDVAKAESTWQKLTGHPHIKNNSLIHTVYLLILRIHKMHDLVFKMEKEMNVMGLNASDVIFQIKQIMFYNHHLHHHHNEDDDDDGDKECNEFGKDANLYDKYIQILNVFIPDSSLMHSEKFMVEIKMAMDRIRQERNGFDYEDASFVDNSINMNDVKDENDKNDKNGVDIIHDVIMDEKESIIHFDGINNEIMMKEEESREMNGKNETRRCNDDDDVYGDDENVKNRKYCSKNKRNEWINDFIFHFFEFQRIKRIRRLSSIYGVLEMYSYGRNYNHAMAMFGGMQDLGFSPQIDDYNAILSICKNRKDEKMAENTFQKMAENVSPNLTTFVILLKCYAKTCNYEKANALFHHMQKLGYIPSFDCLIHLSLAAARTRKNFSKSYQIFQKMIKSDTVSDARIFNVAIEAYSRNKEFETCKQIFYKMRNKGIHGGYMIHSSMIISSCKCEQLDQALQMLRRMKVEGFKPSAQVYMHVINLCMKEERYDACTNMMVTMVKNETFFDLRAISEIFLRYSKCIRCGFKTNLHMHFKKSTPKMLQAGILALEKSEPTSEVWADVSLALDQTYKSDADVKDKKNVCLTLVTGLWEVGSSEAAMKMFRVAREKKLLPGIMRQTKRKYEASLTDVPHSVATTLVRVLLYDYWLSCDAGSECVVRSFALRVGGKGKRPKAVKSFTKPALQVRIESELDGLGSPLVYREGWFVGDGWEVCSWLTRIHHLLT